MPSFPTGKTPWVLGTNGTTVNPADVREIVIENGIISIVANAFENFINLKKVTLPSSGLNSIGCKAFYNCKSLEDIRVPISVKFYGARAFAGCTTLTTVDLWNPQAKTKSVAASYSADSGIEIGAFAFENCTSLANINLFEEVSEIGIGAFSGCSAMTEVNLPASIEEIPDTAFFGCSSLQEINIPENIDVIGDGAFSGCSAAETITIPEGVEIIGDQAFSGCSAVTAVTIPESADEIGAGLFTNCTALSDVTLPENMEYIGDAMFSGCSALEAIEIPESVENIGDGAFGYCSSLESVNIPENVSIINNSIFTGCNALETIDIPESIVTIGDYAFSSCSNLSSVSMGEGTTTIGVGAFSFCSALETVDFPASVSLIDEGAFMGCSSLTNVEFMDSELIIEKLAFSGCSALSNVELPEEIIYVGEDAFASCSDDMNIVCFTSSSVYDGLALESTNITPIIPVTCVTISQTSANMNAGKALTLGAQAVPANATCPNIIWSSNNPSVATVDENGVVTAIRGGEATITATTQDNAFVAECVVNVVVPVEGIEMLNSELEAYSIDEFMLSYAFTPANPSNIDVEWSSSNEDVATVSEDGTVTLHKSGEAIITVTTDDGGFTSSCKITATDYVPVEAVEFENANITLYTGDTTTLSPRAVPENATETYLELYIDETDVISLDEDGVVTALKPGTAKVYATSFDGIEGYCTITVKDKAEMGIQSIAVESKPSKTSFRYKETGSMSLDGLKLKVTYVDGSSDIISDTSKMKVSGFSTNEQGEHTASVEYYGKTASFTYSVNLVWWQWIIRIFLLGFLWY